MKTSNKSLRSAPQMVNAIPRTSKVTFDNVNPSTVTRHNYFVNGVYQPDSAEIFAENAKRNLPSSLR
jgi:hypothetical protein